MKKIISVLLAVLTVFSMFVITASAAKAPTITVKADTTAVKVGDTVKVTVSTSKNSKLCSATISLVYDPEYFQVVNQTSTAAFSMERFGEIEGKVMFLGITNSKISDSATELFTAEFKILKTGGTIELLPEEVYVVDGDNDVNVTDKIRTATLTFNDECNCNCHKSGISKFFFDFALFFQKLFGANKDCACGVAHY